MNAEALPHQVRSAEEWSAWVQAIAWTMPGPAELAWLVDDPWGEPKQQTSPLAPETIASGLTPCAGNALRWIEVRERDGPSGGRRADVGPVEFDYRRTRIAVENTGHTIEMTPEPGNAIVLDGERYDLLQFHFRLRSEHLVGGARFPLEMHLVHRNGGGELAVIGAPFTQGEANDALAPAWAHLPPDPGAPRAVSGELGLASLLPFLRTTWRYTGSLTPPPCTEGVVWIVPAEPLPMSAALIAAFAAIHPHNWRSVQRLGERVLYRGSCPCPEKQEGLG